MWRKPDSPAIPLNTGFRHDVATKIPMIGALGESLAGLRLLSWACQRHAPRI